MSRPGLSSARTIFARELEAAWHAGYMMAAVEAERAVYSGDLYEWLRSVLNAEEVQKTHG